MTPSPRRIRVYSRRKVGSVDIDTEIYSGGERRAVGSHSIWVSRRNKGGWRKVKMRDLPRIFPEAVMQEMVESAKKVGAIFRELVKEKGRNEARAKAVFIRQRIRFGEAVISNGEFLGVKIMVGWRIAKNPIHYQMAYNPFTNKFWYASTRRKSDNITEDEPSEKNIGKG